MCRSRGRRTSSATKQAKKTQLPTPMMGPPRAVLGPPNTKPPIGQHSRPAAARNRSGGRVHFMATERYQALAPSQTDPLPTVVGQFETVRCIRRCSTKPLTDSMAAATSKRNPKKLRFSEPTKTRISPITSSGAAAQIRLRPFGFQRAAFPTHAAVLLSHRLMGLRYPPWPISTGWRSGLCSTQRAEGGSHNIRSFASPAGNQQA